MTYTPPPREELEYFASKCLKNEPAAIEDLKRHLKNDKVDRVFVWKIDENRAKAIYIFFDNMNVRINYIDDALPAWNFLAMDGGYEDKDKYHLRNYEEI